MSAIVAARLVRPAAAGVADQQPATPSALPVPLRSGKTMGADTHWVTALLIALGLLLLWAGLQMQMA